MLGSPTLALNNGGGAFFNSQGAPDVIMERKADDGDRLATFLPTPEQIKEACREIQATWPPGEERKRRLWADAPVRFPALSVLHVEHELAP